MTNRKTVLENKLEKLQKQLEQYQNNPDEQIDLKVGELETALENIDKKEPSKKENKSMYEHLNSLKKDILEDETAWVNARIDEIKKDIDEVEAELEEI
jgi:uncharacterized protein YydD (DUF2326 family)